MGYRDFLGALVLLGRLDLLVLLAPKVALDSQVILELQGSQDLRVYLETKEELVSKVQ
jgi:hypothetical protein